ncbi:MAG: DUF1684 domain-containing protein [Candidatus Eisenbacteria bacterium]
MHPESLTAMPARRVAPSASLRSIGAFAALLLCAHSGFAATPRVAARPVAPVKLAASTTDSLRAACAKDRQDTADNLRTSATSYLAAVARTDFADKTALVLGRAADCDLRVDDPELAAHHLRVTVQGDSFRVEAIEDTAHFMMRGGAIVRATTSGPGFVRVGRFTVRLSHQRYPALIVFDPQSPHFAAYHGLDWFPFDPSYRYVAPLTPNPNADTTLIMSTRGNARRAVLAGWFDLLVHGKPARLEAHRLLEPGVDEKSVSIFFRDTTTGRESYGVGRYIDPELLPDGTWLVDFNNAYNPACATSPYYNCPIPSRRNTLKLAIKAGEKDSHYAH